MSQKVKLSPKQQEVVNFVKEKSEINYHDLVAQFDQRPLKKLFEMGVLVKESKSRLREDDQETVHWTSVSVKGAKVETPTEPKSEEKSMTVEKFRKTKEYQEAGEKCQNVDLTQYGHNIQGSVLRQIMNKYGKECANSIIDDFDIQGVRKEA